MRQSGFTVVELLFVLVVGTILGSIGMSEFARVQSSFELENARDSFVMLSMRARAAAATEGELVYLEIDPATDAAEIRSASGTVIEEINYTGDIEADVTTESGSAITVCYSSRGFAFQSCSSKGWVAFQRGGDETRLEVQALGQVIRI